MIDIILMGDRNIPGVSLFICKIPVLDDSLFSSVYKQWYLIFPADTLYIGAGCWSHHNDSAGMWLLFQWADTCHKIGAVPIGTYCKCVFIIIFHIYTHYILQTNLQYCYFFFLSAWQSIKPGYFRPELLYHKIKILTTTLIFRSDSAEIQTKVQFQR